jgi:putative redox protein
MSERVILRQKANFDTELLATDPHGESDEMQPVEHVLALSPYGMLLASLAGCTAVLLTTYAQNHNLPLEEVELRLKFDRTFDEDCENCESVDEYREIIAEEIIFSGNLTAAQRQKLLAISRHCPIHKMVHEGIEVRSQLGED